MSSSPPPKRRRYGGQRQRLARAAEADVHPEAKSFLADELLAQWSWGRLSPQTLQHFASLAAKDFKKAGCEPPPRLAMLAGIGQHGKNPQHMHKELVAHCNKSCKLHQPHLFYTPLKDHTQKVLQQSMMPHQLFSDIYNHYGGAWVHSIVPQEEELARFWDLQKNNHPQWAGHPISKRKDLNFCAPLALHGDGTPTLGVGKLWSKQLTIFSFSSLLSLGSTKNTLFHVWNVFDETANDETWDHFFAELAWSFEWLWKGKFPDRDANGTLYPSGSVESSRALQPLAGPYYGCLWALLGDMEYLSSVLRLPHYARKSGPCSICRCTGGSEATSWKDCRLTAPWRGLVWKKDQCLSLTICGVF